MSFVHPSDHRPLFLFLAIGGAPYYIFKPVSRMVDYWNKSPIKQASFVNWKALSLSTTSSSTSTTLPGQSVIKLMDFLVGSAAVSVGWCLSADKTTCKLSKILLFEFKFRFLSHHLINLTLRLRLLQPRTEQNSRLSSSRLWPDQFVKRTDRGSMKRMDKKLIRNFVFDLLNTNV